VEDWNWETIFSEHYRSIFNHCDIIGLKICRIQWKKHNIRAITAFKVIKGHRGRYQSNWETIFSEHYRSIFNHCDIIGLKICRIQWKKTQHKGHYGVQGHYRSSRSVPIESPNATNWHPISYLFGVIAANCNVQTVNTLRFLATPWGLRDNLRSSSWAH